MTCFIAACPPHILIPRVPRESIFSQGIRIGPCFSAEEHASSVVSVRFIDGRPQLRQADFRPGRVNHLLFSPCVCNTHRAEARIEGHVEPNRGNSDGILLNTTSRK